MCRWIRRPSPSARWGWRGRSGRSRTQRRLAEAARLAFTTALVPAGTRGAVHIPAGLRVLEMPDIRTAVGHVARSPTSEMASVTEIGAAMDRG